jgi:hypothetical protein
MMDWLLLLLLLLLFNRDNNNYCHYVIQIIADRLRNYAILSSGRTMDWLVAACVVAGVVAGWFFPRSYYNEIILWQR